MGVEQYECVIATTWNDSVKTKLKEWISHLNDEEQSLFVFVPALVNNKETLFLAPSGSKRGWDIDERFADLRKRLVEYIETFKYEDGSSPISWIEVGFGELGQEIINRNCKYEQ